MKGWTDIEVAFAILGYVFAGFMVFMMIVYIAMLVLNARTPTPPPPRWSPCTAHFGRSLFPDAHAHLRRNVVLNVTEIESKVREATGR